MTNYTRGFLTEQALKAKRFGKSMMEHSIHQAYKVQRRASTGHNQSKLVKSSSRRSSSSSSFQSNDHASKSSKRRSKRRVSISLPKEHGNSDPNSAKRKSNVEMEERDEEKRGMCFILLKAVYIFSLFLYCLSN